MTTGNYKTLREQATTDAQRRVEPVVSCEPAREVWVVSNNAEGPSFVAQYKQGACDHASLMAGDFPEFSPWQVTHYIAAPFVASKFIEMHGEEFTCKFIKEIVICGVYDG